MKAQCPDCGFVWTDDEQIHCPSCGTPDVEAIIQDFAHELHAPNGDVTRGVSHADVQRIVRELRIVLKKMGV